MEKRRRARINESLGQLKTLILDALKKDVSSDHFKAFNHSFVIMYDLKMCLEYRFNFQCCVPTELQTLQAGESRYPGDDSEALAEPAARADER